MKVSFVIRFKNEEKYIQTCVESILKQEGDFDFELIFVNDHTTDASLDYVKSLQKSPPPRTEVKLVNLEGEFTLAKGNNAGLPHCTGDFVGMITMHSEIAKLDSLLRMIENFEDPKVAGVYSRVIGKPETNTLGLLAKNKVNPPHRIVRSKEYFYTEHDHKRLGNYLFVGTFRVMRAELFKSKENWFHNLPKMEDLEWSYRMINAGHKIVYEPRSILFHYDEDNLKRLVKRWVSASVASSLIFTKKAPRKLAVLKGGVLSLSLFLFKVSVAEPRFVRKFVYFGMLFAGNFLLAKEVIFNYRNYGKWEERYRKSFSEPPV